MKRKVDRHDVYLLMVAVIWGLNYVIAKIGILEMGPMVFNALRFLSGTIVCWIFQLFSRHQPVLTARQVLMGVMTGVFALGINQVAFVYGLSMTTSGAAAIILAATPVVVAVIAFFLKLESLNWKMWVGIGVSFIGVLLVTLGASGELVMARGNLYVVIAMIFWSIYTIAIRLLSSQMSMVQATTLSITSAAAFFSVLTFPQLLQIQASSFSQRAWASVLFSGIMVFGISYNLWNYGIKKVGPTRTSVYANLPPFISVLFAYWVFAESMTPVQLLGGALIISSLYQLNRSRKPLPAG